MYIKKTKKVKQKAFSKKNKKMLDSIKKRWYNKDTKKTKEKRLKEVDNLPGARKANHRSQFRGGNPQ